MMLFFLVVQFTVDDKYCCCYSYPTCYCDLFLHSSIGSRRIRDRDEPPSVNQFSVSVAIAVTGPVHAPHTVLISIQYLHVLLLYQLQHDYTQLCLAQERSYSEVDFGFHIH